MIYRVESLIGLGEARRLTYTCGHIHRSEAAAQRCATRIARAARRRGEWCRTSIEGVRGSEERPTSARLSAVGQA